jgi:hypothetical protein
MYSGTIKIYYRKTVGHVFTKPVQIEETTEFFPPVSCFFYLKARIIATVKNISAPMLTHVWQEREYRIEVCRVTRGAHMEHL